MLVLGIESSCDETAAAVAEFTEDGEKRILSNAVASQISIHKLYGGVVPEIAGRAHSEAICPIVTEALTKAGKTVKDIDLIGVTSTPGLVGALLIVALFAVTILRGYWIALHAADRFSTVLCAGLVTLIAVQTVLNLCVVTNLLPSTGIALPFFSYGGTALAVNLGEMGVILSVSRYRNQAKKQEDFL